MSRMKHLIEEIADDYGVDFDTASEILQGMVEDAEDIRKETERDRLLPDQELRNGMQLPVQPVSNMSTIPEGGGE